MHLRLIRIILAALFFIAVLAIFLDFTGVLPAYLGWVAQIQLIPAILALNLGILAILLVLTLLFGRLYCSIICPLGIFQDLWSALRGKKRKYQFREQTKKRRIIRYTVLVLFLSMIFAGCSVGALIEPYSAFGRMAASLFAPIYDAVNNQLASIAEQHESYAFYDVDIWIRGTASFILAIITFVGLAVCGILTGRSYCANFCPVGTLLGLFSRFSLFKVRLDKDKCKKCQGCSNKCKAHCIDVQNHTVDAERCISCMNCLTACKFGAISYKPSLKNMIDGLPHKTSKKSENSASEIDATSENSSAEADKTDNSQSATNSVKEDEQVNARRQFLAATAAVAGTALCPALAFGKEEEGNLASVSRKEEYPRETLITPPGSKGHLNYFHHCTGCMLCVRACHNQVLRTVSKGKNILHPVLSYEKSYCRPTCNDCSKVCPTGAIREITLARKSSTQIGRAVWNREACLSASKGEHCRACSRICPSGAISFTTSETPDGKKCKIPVVNTERCIGCGACEYVCPARPLAAIHVEGNMQHHEI